MADLKRRIIAEFSAKNKARGEMAGFRRDMDRTGQSMINMAKGALAMVGLGGGLYAVKRGFDYVTKAAMKQEDALFLLEAALKTAGEYSFGTMKKFEAFAASIQQATIYGDEEVLALMQLMKSLGVTSNKLEQATRMAIGLAAATGRDVKSMSMYIALAQQGEFTMLRRYIPALRSTTDATEQLRIITEFAAAGFEIAKAKAETASGAIAQMKNAYSDVAEVIGDAFLPSMKEMSKRQKTFLEENQSVLKDYLTLVAEGAEMLDWASRKFLGVMPPVLIYKALTKPEEKKKVLPPAGGIVRFEEPEWLKATLALNVMTEAQKKAAASMYEMSMKARGLGEELAREKQITQFAALAKVRYGADVAGAQAAQERFTKALKEFEEAKIAAAAKAKEMANARERELEKIRLEEQRWDDVARAMEDSFANAFEAMAFEGKKFGDVMKVVAREILMEMMRIMMFRPVAKGLADWLTPALSGLAGGLFGGAGMPTVGTVTPQAGAMYTSYQHGGEVLKTGLAMVHKGETFSGVQGGGGGDTHVHIHNEQGEDREVSHVEQYMVSDQRIIDVFTRKAQTDGPLRRSIKQAKR